MVESLLRMLRRATPVLGLAIACGLSATAPAGAQGASQHFEERYRELDAAESTRAKDAARGAAIGELRRRAGREAGAPERVELLRVDLHRHPKDAPRESYRRRADVYVYDYDTDELAWTVFDLDANRVESVAVTPGAQLPLSDREVERALDLVLEDPASAARIREEFAQVAGRPMRSKNELRVAGFVYRADSMPHKNTPDSALCGRHRCAQLLLHTNNIAIELPIVDLSRERVLESRRFGPVPDSAPAQPDEAHDHAH
jgi:hypothetical protein